MNKYIRNVFNIRSSVSIDTKLNTYKIRMYDVEYTSGACRLARVRHALLVR